MDKNDRCTVKRKVGDLGRETLTACLKVKDKGGKSLPKGPSWFGHDGVQKRGFWRTGTDAREKVLKACFDWLYFDSLSKSRFRVWLLFVITALSPHVWVTMHGVSSTPRSGGRKSDWIFWIVRECSSAIPRDYMYQIEISNPADLYRTISAPPIARRARRRLLATYTHTTH
jgi:hypothetical protein